jgi:DNA primase
LAGFIPDEIVDRVRSATDIVDLVSEYVSLKKSGANYLGLCPFHNEKTPSFTVSPSKQIFHCFGCGAGGDAVGFLIRHDNYTFPEAVRRLADRAGIEIPEEQRRTGVRPDVEGLVRANEAAAGFFAGNLKDSPEADRARKYLEGRGFDLGLASAYGLGYGMPAWDGLLKQLARAGINAQTAEKAGLVLKKQSGQGHYDRFRDRLMFTINDIRGRVVGFGGRALDDSEPKYLNSPETPLFKKGETLYLADIAAEHIRKRGFAIVTEGYFDAIACHRAGVKNAVATLGTALTPMHLRLIGRFAKNVLLVFDSDAAGIKAAERSLDVFLPTGMTAKVALLPPGDDPDSLFAREGTKGLKARLGKSEKLLDFVLGRIAGGADTLDEKVAAAAKATEVLSRIPNAVERSQYLGVAAGLLGVSETALSEELDKALGRQKRRTRPARKRAASTSRIEEELLLLALRYPGAALEVGERVSAEDFTDPKLRAIAEKALGLVGADGTINVHRLLDALDEEEQKSFVTELISRQGEYETPDETARATLDRLYSERLEAAGAELAGLMDAAQSAGDEKRIKELVELGERIRRLKGKPADRDFRSLSGLMKCITGG